MKPIRILFALAALAFTAPALAQEEAAAEAAAPQTPALPAYCETEAAATEGETMHVTLTTGLGEIVLELDAQNAPVTTANFLRYVRGGHFAGTLFHRVIPGFMIQGGGFDANFNEKPTCAPIENEAANGLSNVRGSIAMARTPDPNSATAQFFINLVDNASLNYSSTANYGYAVFGKVVAGMDVVDEIANVETGERGPHADVPVENVLITAAAESEAPPADDA